MHRRVGARQDFLHMAARKGEMHVPQGKKDQLRVGLIDVHHLLVGAVLLVQYIVQRRGQAGAGPVFIHPSGLVHSGSVMRCCTTQLRPACLAR